MLLHVAKTYFQTRLPPDANTILFITQLSIGFFTMIFFAKYTYEHRTTQSSLDFLQNLLRTANSALSIDVLLE
ncbi:hypothetical protein CCS41_11300 [Candidatus Fukatsuia symbiotica]|uniref:Uncharacterized protein n=1 Tax=Candidatus Fukatsuia symbiotica TaxID=1878942 RepID=A0A2U8IA29_9GAMM|nr:hypothetical protein CCS41_11300 [Candidatus Fukatsuia symbiotica]